MKKFIQTALISSTVRVFRCISSAENEKSSIIEYKIAIDDMEVLVPAYFFEQCARKYPVKDYYEYVYLDENYQTYRVFQSEKGISSEQ